MKKSLAALTGAAAVIGGAAYGISDALFKALISREFRVPKAVSKFITEKEEGAENPLENKYKQCMKYILSYGLERHEIISNRGQKLRGYLMKPAKPSDVYVFGSHGYRSDGKGEWCYFAKFYVEEMGWNLFFVDHQSHGESEGEYIGFASHEHKDCLKWLEYINNTFGKDIKIILHGISMGSATVMLMSGNDALAENVKFTVADCGYTSAMDEFDYKIDSLKLPFKPLIPMISAINRKRAGYDFKKDTDALSAVKKAKVPVLFIHGDKDLFVPTKMVYELYDACTSEKELFVVPGADHAKSYHVDPEGYEARVKEMAEKYL